MKQTAKKIFQSLKKPLPQLEELLEQNRIIDAYFGLSPRKVEVEQLPRIKAAEYYPGIDPEALSTSYYDFTQIFEYLALAPGQSFIDLGAGYGRSVLLLSELYPQTVGKAYEYVGDRIKAAQEFVKAKGRSSHTFLEQDLLAKDFQLANASAYFLYLDIGPLCERLLEQIQVSTSNEPSIIIAIESHGDLIPRIQLEPWLELDKKILSASPRHNPWIYFFKSKPPETCRDFLLADQTLMEQWRKLKEIPITKDIIPLVIRHHRKLSIYAVEVQVSSGTSWYGSLEGASFHFYDGEPYINFSSGSLATFSGKWNTKVTKLIRRDLIADNSLPLR